MDLKLILSNVCKSYNGKNVLRNCFFSFHEIAIYVVTGPNGSGKSTLLRICALLESPDEGELNYYSGADVLKKNIELKRRITLLLPRVGIFNATVFKNLAYGLKIRGLKKKEVEEKVNRALKLVGLIHKKDQHALTLSSGESQRLGIARAMVIEPEILFFDEPTASIDQENTEIIENIILNMKKESRKTVIITTHDRAQAERLADRILIMEKSGIIEG